MGLFDRFKKRGNQQLLQPNIPLPEDPSQSEKIYNSIDRRKIPSEELDRMQKVKASETYCNLLRRLFFSDYPEMPYISKDRELYTDWIEQAKMFPNNVISKKMMTRYTDGLLPGHVYMLYWISRYNMKRRIPSYFEYKYGIDFVKETEFLISQGYLDANNKLTDKGNATIQAHSEVVEEHQAKNAKSKWSFESASKQILEQKKSLRRNGFKEYLFLSNNGCCPICAELNGKHFQIKNMEIGVNAPPMHENCSCSISAYEDEGEYQEWLDFISKGGTTEEWKKRKQ